MNKKQYLISNLFAWGLVLFLITNHIFGWTTPTEDPPGGNIVLETGGATPAGSTGYIQFNDNGNLGANSGLFWDNSNKRLGIGTTNPKEKLEVSGNIKLSGTSPSYKISNVATPTADSDVATKEYIDEAIKNLVSKNFIIYCMLNPGESVLNGDVVYCDQYYNMWSITLNSTYQYKTSNTALPEYANGDCNNLTAEDMADYPACNACYNLSYAGFSEGWQLPTQNGRDGTYCAPGRQLWNLGQETCDWSSAQCGSAQSSCLPSYDSSAVAAYYWSSTESGTGAWFVYFNSGYVNGGNMTNSYRVRCVLGQ